MNNKPTSNHLLSTYPVGEPSTHAKQDTIHKARLLLSQQTKFMGAKKNFVWNQVKSISKVFWLIQLFCFAVFLFNFSSTEDLENAQILFLTIVPVMTFYILPELLKAQLYHMSEMEAVCFFNPVRVIAVKMVLVGSCNLFLIGTASLTLGIYHQLDILELLCRGLIPFNLSIALTITAFDFIKITSPYAMLSVSALLTWALIQMRYVPHLLDNRWLDAYLGSTLLMLLAVTVTVIRLRQMEGRFYGT